MSFLRKTAPVYNLIIFYLSVSFISRIILLFHPITQSTFEWTDIFKIFTFGLVSDFFVFVLISGLLWLYLIFISNKKYIKPYGYIILGFLIALFIYIFSGKSILNEYGGALPQVGLLFVGIKTLLFGLLLFLPNHRDKIRYWLFSFAGMNLE